MDTKFEIYIPTNNTKVVREYASEITKEFGGCTVRPGAEGLWTDPSNYVLHDAITIIEVYALKESLSKVTALAQKIAKNLNQQCVSVTVTPAKMMFIYP